MPHFPKPYFLTSRGVWKVQIRGKQHNLGPDEAEAFRRYHRLMAAPAEPAAAPPPPISIVAVLDTFLGWCREHRAPDGYEPAGLGRRSHGGPAGDGPAVRSPA